MKPDRARNLVIYAGLLSYCMTSVAAENILEEIIVTATKRGDMDIQTIPASIHAIGGTALEDKSQTIFRDIASAVPGLTFQDLGPGDMEFIIRGVNGNGPAVVGTYFGEYVITANDQQDGGGKNAPIKLVDMERIEVLNGPQGTLYGANSMAGNIRFIPRKADPSAFDAFVDLESSSIDSGGDGYSLTAGINVPLGEGSSALRLVAYRTDNDGWVDQPRLERNGSYDVGVNDINSEETDGVRISAVFEPTENATLDLLYLHQESDIGGSSRFTAKGVTAWPDRPGYTPVGGVPLLTTADDFINTDITQSPRVDDVDLLGATLTFGLDTGNIVLSASNYQHDIDFTFDSTPILAFFGVPLPGITNQPQSYEIDMLEARFASSFDGAFNFVGGVYAQNEDQEFTVHVTTTDGNGGNIPWDPASSNDACTLGGTTFFGRDRVDEIEQKALFGEVTFDINEKWQLTGGARWFDVDLTSTQQTIHGFCNGTSVAIGEPIGENENGNTIGRITDSDDNVNFMAALSYQYSDDIMFFGRYSEGFRTGGVNNANQPFTAPIPPVYASDELQNIEFGIKSQLNDNRTQFNATVFIIDWDDIQVEPRDPAGNIPFTVNGGSAEITGMEFSLTALLSDNLRANLTGTYFFSHELTTDQPLPPIPPEDQSPFIILGLDGDEIPNVADTQLYASLQYDTSVSDMGLSLIGDVTYRGSTNTEFRPENPFNIKLDSYTQLNLYANLELNENFSLSAYLKNATDELGIIDGIGTFQDPEAVVALRPRTVGLRLQWKY
jgi:outer membrane receptor protein involved in Fe transport